MKTLSFRPHGLVRSVWGVLALVLALGAVPAARAGERWATLEAIHQLENPRNSSKPGPYGELGAYQFREEVWYMHSSAPFRHALDRAASDVVAVKHYEWIKAQLQNHGLEVTPYMIALVWNGGMGAALQRHPPRGAVDYATRAAAMTSQYEGAQLAADQ